MKTYKMNPIASTMDKAIEKLNELNKIEISYFIRRGVHGKFDKIFINRKPDMTPSDVFDIVRRRHKKDKNITELRLIDLKLES